jgi:hypothetical protein
MKQLADNFSLKRTKNNQCISSYKSNQFQIDTRKRTFREETVRVLWSVDGKAD